MHVAAHLMPTAPVGGEYHSCHVTDGESEAQKLIRGHTGQLRGQTQPQDWLTPWPYYLLDNAAPVLLYKPGFSKVSTEIAEIMGKPD